jgi:poly(3-hydroxyalkanoate) synthetase
MVSWRNVKKPARPLTWDDYIDGRSSRRSTRSQRITKRRQVNALGLLHRRHAARPALAVLEKKGRTRREL